MSLLFLKDFVLVTAVVADKEDNEQDQEQKGKHTQYDDKP